MNQILKIKVLKNQMKEFKIQLFISLILTILFTIYLFYFYINKNKTENISNVLLNNFNVEHLYSQSFENTMLDLTKPNYSSIIGIIEIPKINIKYPIFSDISDDLLKISVCRFYGPYSNKIGNLCIAAHNYDNNSFFSNLYKLDIGDIVNIYDTNNLLVSYYVYDKFETLKSDISCTNQNTEKKREITLVTCNNINKNRLIVKAKEK